MQLFFFLFSFSQASLEGEMSCEFFNNFFYIKGREKKERGKRKEERGKRKEGIIKVEERARSG